MEGLKTEAREEARETLQFSLDQLLSLTEKSTHEALIRFAFIVLLLSDKYGQIFDLLQGELIEIGGLLTNALYYAWLLNLTTKSQEVQKLITEKLRQGEIFKLANSKKDFKSLLKILKEKYSEQLLRDFEALRLNLMGQVGDFRQV